MKTTRDCGKVFRVRSDKAGIRLQNREYETTTRRATACEARTAFYILSAKPTYRSVAPNLMEQASIIDFTAASTSSLVSVRSGARNETVRT